MKPLSKAALTSAGLSLLFLGVYSSCSIITTLRADVGSFYFPWERSIPFIPAFILPYMSIDLFFIAAPFLARSDRERITVARRIAAAIIIAGVCFLLFPLRLTYERSHVDGFLGVIFNNFRALDGVFNQFPSLHIALSLILFDLYGRRLRKLVHLGVILWFALIGLSPLFTHQHQIVDIFGGFVLGVLCLHFFDETPLRQPFTANHRIGTYYAAGAAILTLFAFVWTPWTCLLLWPASSVAMVAVAYVFLGPGIFRKRQGTLSWTTWLLLGPVLIGQRLSWMYYARQCRPWDRVVDHLWIGRHLSPSQARQLRVAGVTAVLDLAPEFSEPRSLREAHYLSLPILDLTAPTPDQINQAIAFIHRHGKNGIVYVHCKIGYSRTAAIAGAYLMASGHVDGVAQAVSMLRHARPSIILRSEVLAALQTFSRTSNGSYANFRSITTTNKTSGDAA